MNDLIVVETPTTALTVQDQVTQVDVVQLGAMVVVSVPTAALIVQEQITQIEILELGAQGIPGVKGDSAFFYQHNQSIPSAVWTITHNLNCYPTAVVFDSGGSQCEGIFSYSSLNVMVITFSAAFSGVANII